MIKLGDLYARTGKLGQAVSAYQEALKYRPNDKAVLDKIQAIKDLRT
jgi:cytochrome c-type biogenesis protein CcmH/NrfG